MWKLPHFKTTKSNLSIGILTSGGDAPGMNAAIRAAVRFGIARGCRVYGIMRGYTGILEGQIEELDAKSVANIIQRGGTVLKTSRCDAWFRKSVRRDASQILKRKGIDALITIGGDGTFTGAHLLESETGFPCIGVPGTIDNDIEGTEDTIGFDTAVNTAIESIDRIRDTASSHERIFLVEVMGRNTGFIAAQVGIGGGAETVVVPEKKQSVSSIVRTIERGIKRGKTSSIIVVAEGTQKGGLANVIAKDLAKRHFSSRVAILGHTQRGGSPTAHDRVLASALGAAAVGYLLDGKSDSMVGVQKDQVVLVSLRKMLGHRKRLNTDLLDLAQVLAT